MEAYTKLTWHLPRSWSGQVVQRVATGHAAACVLNCTNHSESFFCTCYFFEIHLFQKKVVRWSRELPLAMLHVFTQSYQWEAIQPASNQISDEFQISNPVSGSLYGSLYKINLASFMIFKWSRVATGTSACACAHSILPVRSNPAGRQSNRSNFFQMNLKSAIQKSNHRSWQGGESWRDTQDHFVPQSVKCWTAVSILQGTQSKYGFCTNQDLSDILWRLHSSSEMAKSKHGD